MQVVRGKCECGTPVSKSVRTHNGKRQTVFACPNFPTGKHVSVVVDEGNVYEVIRSGGRTEVGVGGR